jgi:iron-sulfur cluster assembly protein
MFTVTDLAAEKIKELISENDHPDKLVFRISYGRFGCGSSRLYLTLDDLINEDDLVVDAKGAKVVYSNSLEQDLKDATLDYSNKLFSKSFNLTGTKYGVCKMSI